MHVQVTEVRKTSSLKNPQLGIMSSPSCLLLLLSLIGYMIPIFGENNDYDGKTVINIYAITTSFTVGESLERGHSIAIDVINEDDTILPSYYLNLTVLKSGDDSTQALLHALQISYQDQSQNLIWDNSSAYDFLIVLGCDWSSLSTVTAPTLSAFEWAQISSTSVILSETSSFSYFYRTISNDELQSRSLIDYVVLLIGHKLVLFMLMIIMVFI